MIVDFDKLSDLRGQVTMVDGCFDPLHSGHIDYFRAAHRLGRRVLCNVAPDWVLAQKRVPLMPQQARRKILDEIKLLRYVYAGDKATAHVLRELRPCIYAKGKDWEGRLPEEEVRACQAHGTEVVYLDTVRDSSSRLIEEMRKADVAQFEQRVHEQHPTPPERYSEEYYTGEWRGGQGYTLEERRQAEGLHPALIIETFAPRVVLDVGCGTGCLMMMLMELGAQCVGVDFSRSARELAPFSARDFILYADVGAPCWGLYPGHEGLTAYELVVCREVLEHLTLFQLREAVRNLSRAGRFVYVTSRFHPQPRSLLDFATEDDLDPTHITLASKEFVRMLFVLEGMKSRRDLEEKMDWQKKGRCLVFEKV